MAKNHKQAEEDVDPITALLRVVVGIIIIVLLYVLLIIQTFMKWVLENTVLAATGFVGVIVFLVLAQIVIKRYFSEDIFAIAFGLLKKLFNFVVKGKKAWRDTEELSNQSISGIKTSGNSKQTSTMAGRDIYNNYYGATPESVKEEKNQKKQMALHSDVPAEKKISKLREQVTAIESLKSLNAYHENFVAWKEKTLAIIRKIFGINSIQEKEFSEVWFTTMSGGGDRDDFYERRAYQNGLISVKSKIEGMIEYLDERFE